MSAGLVAVAAGSIDRAYHVAVHPRPLLPDNLLQRKNTCPRNVCRAGEFAECQQRDVKLAHRTERARQTTDGAGKLPARGATRDQRKGFAEASCRHARLVDRGDVAGAGGGKRPRQGTQPLSDEQFGTTDGERQGTRYYKSGRPLPDSCA